MDIKMAVVREQETHIVSMYTRLTRLNYIYKQNVFLESMCACS